MIEFPITLTSGGSVCLPGRAYALALGYTKNRGVYRLHVDATGEWEGLIIRCFWHVPDGKEPASSLVDGYVDVPASVTAQPGSGCITFEGSDGAKVMTSADLRYRVSANSGTEDGTEPEPGTPAWQQLVDAVHADATAAEQAKTDAQTAAQQAGASAKEAGKALSDTITAKEDALKAIDDKQTAATQAVDTARDKALQQVDASTEAAQTAASEAATSAGNASQSAARSSAAASNANASAENAARAQVTASQLAGQAADSASEAQNSATKAADSQQAAESSAAAAQGSATKANASASEAAQGQQRAEAAATRAETAQQQTESASTDALDKISSAKTDALKALDTKQTSATTAVESAQGKALDAVTDAQNTATQAVQAEQASATTAVKKAGAEVLASIPEDYQTTVQKVKELDAQKVETDEAISAVKARQNVLTGSEIGNPLSVDDAFAAPLCGLTVYGRSTQDGTPTPDAPVPIVSAGDGGSLTVKVTGKNLLHLPDGSGTGRGVTITAKDGLISISGTATETGYSALEIPPFITSGVAILSSSIASPMAALVAETWDAVLSQNTAAKMPTTATRLVFIVTQGQTYNLTGVKVQLELGSPATTYSPYREQLLTLPTPTGLPGIPVTSGGSYTDSTGQQWVCDEVDLERGMKVKKIASFVINAENANNFFVTNDFTAITVAANARLATPQKTKRDDRQYGRCVFCEALPWKIDAWASPVNAIGFVEDNSVDLTIENSYLGLSEASTNAERKTALVKYFTDNPCHVVYRIATPIETPLTPAELATYSALTAYGPDTVVQAGDGAGVKLDYQRDVNLVVKNLKDAIASMT